MIKDSTLITIELLPEEAIKLRMFEQNYAVVAPILGFMDNLGIKDMRGCKITFDVNPDSGVIEHVAITKHYR